MSNSGSDYLRITAAGSAVVKNIPFKLSGYAINSAYVGTIQLYDNPSGTATLNPLTIGTPNFVPDVKQVDLGFKKGGYYVATGTPDVTLIIE